MGPSKPYVTIILSMPVWGVENKKEVTAPLEAPCFLSEADTGITEHEHNGRGTPKIDALNIDKIPCRLPRFFSIISFEMKIDNKPANRNPWIKYGDIANNKFQILIFQDLLFLLISPFKLFQDANMNWIHTSYGHGIQFLKIENTTTSIFVFI